MKVRVGGILDMSTIDYSGKVSSVIFFHGCNFRCPFCYNIALVEGNDYQELETTEVIEKIKKHKNFIDAVTITGGEPTLQIEGLKELCEGLKSMKLLVKLDTNGYRPDVVKKLLDDNLLDFVSVDIKASSDKYNELAGINCDLTRIKHTLEVLRNSEVDYELRTTIVPGANDSEEDIRKVCDFIKPTKAYVLQQFRHEGGTLDKSLSNTPKMERVKLLKLANVAKKQGLKVKIRTEEEGEEIIKECLETF